MAPTNRTLTTAALIAAVMISLLAVLAYLAANPPATSSEPIPTTDHGTDNTLGIRS